MFCKSYTYRVGLVGRLVQDGPPKTRKMAEYGILKIENLGNIGEKGLHLLEVPDFQADQQDKLHWKRTTIIDDMH
jgi:hypothetical protein